ncbi:hypothetical protein RM550_01570 [Streptomyces sp. DSM 41527]|uniref:Gp5/Type VI secretion system Vgr protein OB-fold domain-containing protein n=1 Tax=Streptomyces mooreae TaxID=3075523 RepID=A0ABU2T0B2_9ACTN|nr:hypothetical protein [Streptomyces sp. DSM 41527]MDT0454428.1 hypothetical protein [Streptomyces sp. DSM 41527]
MTPEESTTDLPALLQPVRGTNPSPLRVSTVAELELGQLVFRFGRNKAEGVSWPVHCKGIKISVPTGASATDLTVEPSLMTYAVNPVSGSSQGTEWKVVPNFTDPNAAVFRLIPETTAKFDGTWQLNLTLSGIEVNASVGTVHLAFEEETSPATAENDFRIRTGRVDVKKSGSEFYFHSLRPRTTVIERGLKVDLLWDGSKNATYRMYYRKADGTETSEPVSGGVWPSPNLYDNANFTLKATIGGEDYYLTTSLTVNNPDITVNNATANGAIRANDGITGPNNESPLEVRGGAGLVVHKSLEVGTYPGGTTTIRNPLTANDTVTVAAGKTLTANGPINAKDSVTVAAGKTLTTNGPINAKDSVTVAAGKTLTTNGPINAKDKVIIATGKALQVDTVQATPGGRTNVAFFSDVWLDEKDLTVKGNLSVAKTNAGTKGDLTARGVAHFAGRVEAVGAPVLIAEFVVSSSRPDQQRTFTAQTSGFVLGTAHAGGGAEHVRLITTAQGASIQDDAHGTSRAGKNSMAVPVAAGRDFTVRAVKQSGASSERWAVGYFYWVPLGTGGATAKTVTADTDDAAFYADTCAIDDDTAVVREGP